MFLFDPFGVEQFDGRMISIQIKSLRDCGFEKYKLPISRAIVHNGSR